MWLISAHIGCGGTPHFEHLLVCAVRHVWYLLRRSAYNWIYRMYDTISLLSSLVCLHQVWIIPLEIQNNVLISIFDNRRRTDAPYWVILALMISTLEFLLLFSTFSSLFVLISILCISCTFTTRRRRMFKRCVEMATVWIIHLIVFNSLHYFLFFWRQSIRMAPPHRSYGCFLDDYFGVIRHTRGDILHLSIHSGNEFFQICTGKVLFVHSYALLDISLQILIIFKHLHLIILLEPLKGLSCRNTTSIIFLFICCFLWTIDSAWGLFVVVYSLK